MRDPRTKRAMVNLALSYQRLAKHAAMREADAAARGAQEQNRERVAFIVVIGRPNTPRSPPALGSAPK
jgi:hypothetical protein